MTFSGVSPSSELRSESLSKPEHPSPEYFSFHSLSPSVLYISFIFSCVLGSLDLDPRQTV